MSTMDNSFKDAAAITPSDTVQLAKACLGIYVGGIGNVTVITYAEYARQKKITQSEVVATILAACTGVLFTAPPVGSIIPISAIAVRATGTTATLMVALLP